jgi:hypothetical protein
MKKEISKSEQRRVAIQKEQGEVEEKETVILTAVENTFLADGTFVAKGAKVEVPVDYAERIKQEANKSFKI